ncbi:MAG: dockerin type I repeat-containing protein, partial [Prevotella sp.]|nr:dockerin type I repeat-containing protein [Prevotella sp.]
EAGTAPTTNLLKGADWIVNESKLQTEQLHDMFELVKEKLGEDFYNNYLAEYEHLLALNAGTINNKYFFGLKAEVAEDVSNLRQLGVDEDESGEMKLGFWENYNALPANKAFLIEEPNPVLIPLWPDITCDGIINVADVTALMSIVLEDDVYAPDWKYPYYNHSIADINQDGIINVTDVTVLMGIVLNLQ